MSTELNPVVAILIAAAAAGGAYVSSRDRSRASGWGTLVASGFRRRAETPIDVECWREARIKMKPLGAEEFVHRFSVQLGAGTAGLFLSIAQQRRRLTLGLPPLCIPWAQIEVMDPEDHRGRGADLCVLANRAVPVLIGVDGDVAANIRAELAARVQPMPAAPPYR